MIDTHAHLNDDYFESQLDTVVQNATKSNIKAIVVPGLDVAYSKKAVRIAHTFPHVFAAVGIYPGQIAKSFVEGVSSDSLQQLVPMLDDPKVVAVGEIGLDWLVCKRLEKEHPELITRIWEAQHWYFVTQFILSAHHDLACIIHNRQATESLLSLLREHMTDKHRNKVVLHCCEADLRLLNLAEEFSFFIGVDGDVTYDKAKQDFIRQVPLERLILETDSPYLTPEPYKSEKLRNQPSYLVKIAEKVAELLNVPVQEVQKQTTTNATLLFGERLLGTH